jgi:hypothetical protein
MWSRAVNKGGHLGKSYWVTFVNDAGYLVRVSGALLFELTLVIEQMRKTCRLG